MEVSGENQEELTIVHCQFCMPRLSTELLLVASNHVPTDILLQSFIKVSHVMSNEWDLCPVASVVQ